MKMTDEGNKKVPWGLVLMGGGARGLAHIGLLEVLEGEGITPDVVTGTSMGAIVGGLYAAGLEARELRRLARDLDLKKYVPPRILAMVRKRNNPILNHFLFDFYIEKALGSKARKGGDRVENYLKNLTGDVQIENLPLKFGCNALDLVSGREHNFVSGPLYKAIRASMAYPVALDPARVRGRLFLDGGIVNNVPVRLAREIGAGKVVVSDIDRPVKPMAASRFKKTFEILERAYHIAVATATKEKLKEADLVLAIPLEVDVLDFSRNDYVMRKGWRAAEENVPAIKRLIGIE